MNPLNYSLAEVQKALIALIGFVGFTVLTFITFDPSLIQAVQLLVPAGVAVIVVFGAKNSTSDDYNKAMQGLLAAALTVVSYFETVPADTANKIGLAVGALAIIIAVAAKRNGSTAAG